MVRTNPVDEGATNESSTTSVDGRTASRMSSRRAFLAATGSTAALSLAGCIGMSQSTMLDSVTYRHRFKRLGLVPAPHDAGVETGTWEDEGLSVDFLSSSGSQETVKSVATGNDDFGDAGMGAVLKAVEDGAPIVILGQEIAPIRGIVTLAENDIETWTDLEGKTIGKFPFAITDMVEEAMKRKGVDLSKIEFQNAEPSASFQLLIDGELDALSRYVPQALDELEYMGHDSVGFYTSNVLDYLGPCVYTRRSMIEDHPETVSAFMRGWLKNFQLFANDIDRVIELYKPKISGDFNEELSLKSLSKLYAAQAPPEDVGTTKGKGWVSEEKMQNTIDTFHQAGIIESTSPVDTYYTQTFLEENQELAIETADALYSSLEEYDIGPSYV